jgi:hypothetical protein
MLVERVSYQIDWTKFKAGWSFFVPCLHPPSARQVILKETKRLKIKVVTKVVIEGGVQGIRVWRT